jgi:tetratricopeptide (TPR) repeat protein
MRNIKYLYLAAILVLTSCGTAQNLISTPVQNQIVKNSSGNEVLLGHCSRSCLLQKSFSEWFEKNHNEYKVDSSQIEELGTLLKDKNISIFLGTWCGDSKREVPRMLKILDAVGVSEKQINLVMLSSDDGMYKQSPQHEEAGKNIFRVPTFIISEGKNEIGRIIEFPKQSLEKDLMEILQKKNYAPNYPAGNSFLQKIKSEELSRLNGEKANLLDELKPRLRNRAELGSIGYVLMDSNEKEKAVFVFELNAELYPGEISVYNALAEGYLSIDNRDKAKAALEKAKAIDAANTETVRLLKKLE